MSTLSDLRDYCKYHGWDKCDLTGLSQLDNFINDTFQILSDLAPWPERQHVDGSAVFLQSAKTLTNITGDGTTVTVTAASHGFETADIVTISGTTNYNISDVRITVTAANTFTYSDDCSETAETAGTATRCGDRKVLSQTRLKKI